MSTVRDPGWCTTDSVLADGGTVHIRPITPEDGAALLAFHARLSDETVRLRFFSNHRYLRPEEVERFTHVDHDRRMALVAVLHQQIIAVARYDHIEADRGGGGICGRGCPSGARTGHAAARVPGRLRPHPGHPPLRGRDLDRQQADAQRVPRRRLRRARPLRSGRGSGHSGYRSDRGHHRSYQPAVESGRGAFHRAPASTSVDRGSGRRSAAGDDRARDLPEPAQRGLQRSRLSGAPDGPSHRQCPRLSHRDAPSRMSWIWP